MDINFLATIAMTVITVLLLLLMLTQKGKHRIRMLLGFLGAVCAVASMVCFARMRAASGGPDAGLEMTQLYGPCAAYLLAAVWSFWMADRDRRKLNAEKAAKLAARAEKKAERQAAKEAKKASSAPSDDSAEA